MSFMTLKIYLGEILQRGIPLVEHPYAALASELDCDEATVLTLTEELIREGYIRSFGAFVDFERLGYQGLLCGLSVPESRMEAVAASLNALNEVTHNYLREHDVNMWCTVLLKGQTETARFVEGVIRSCECPLVVLRTEKRLKLQPSFRFLHDESAGAWGKGDDEGSEWPAGDSFDETLLKFVTPLQRNFPVVPEPFDLAARKAELSVPQLLKILRSLKEKRILRRIGASLHHRRMGYNANALIAWNADFTADWGTRASAFPWVSHCYRRKVVENTLEEDWPYGLYTMVHAADPMALAERIRVMKSELAFRDIVVLSTVRELKKTRYFF